MRDRSVAFDGGNRPLVRGTRAAGAWRETLAAAVAAGLRDLDLTETPAAGVAIATARGAFGPAWDEARVFLAADVAANVFEGGPIPREIVRLDDARRLAGPSETSEVRGVWYPELRSAESAVGPLPGPRPTWVAFPGGLLAPARSIRTVEAWHRRGSQVLLRNVLSGPPLPAGPAGLDPHGPLRLTELEAAWRPVLRLKFLTEEAHRTLPSAALGFAWALGAVPSVSFRDPGEVRQWLVGSQGAALTEAEVDRLRALPETGEPTTLRGSFPAGARPRSELK